MLNGLRIAGVRPGPMPLPVAQACIIPPVSHSQHTQGGYAQRMEKYKQRKTEAYYSYFVSTTALKVFVVDFNSSPNKDYQLGI